MSTEGEGWLRELEEGTARREVALQALADLTPRWPAPRDPALDLAELRILLEDARRAAEAAIETIKGQRAFMLTEWEVALADLESVVARIGSRTREGP